MRNEMRKRGLFNPGALIEHATPDAIRGALGWYDEQPHKGPAAIGPGILSTVIRDGGMPGYGTPAEKNECPCTPELARRWQEVLADLEQGVSEDDWAMRYAPWTQHLHPHAYSDVTGWSIAAEKWVAGWLGDRLEGLRRAARRPVHLVECAAPEPQTEGEEQ